MILTVNVTQENLKHISIHQMGAFAAHCFGLTRFYSIKLFRTYAEVSFELSSSAELVDSVKITQQLQTEWDALIKLDPMPCPCGCGGYLSIGPCLVQAQMTANAGLLIQNERLYLDKGLRIDAIKSIRDRLRCSLKEAVDLANNYLDKKA